MLDEPIHLEKHNPFWRDWFIQEQERLCSLLHVGFNPIEHIGSTAIPGIDAKPVIDIMIGVETFPPAQSLSDTLITPGYEAMGEAGVPERLYFRYRGLRSFNGQLVQREGHHWNIDTLLRFKTEDSKDSSRDRRHRLSNIS